MSKRKQVVNYYKQYGFFKTLKKTIRKIFEKQGRKNHLRYDIIDDIDFLSFSKIILFESNFGWNKIMKQRPQQIAENLPKSTLMIYHSSEDEDFDNKEKIKKVKNNLYIIDLGLYINKIYENLANYKDKYLMIYSTDYMPLSKIKFYKENGFKIIYEYVDDIDEKLCGKNIYKELLNRHNKLIQDEKTLITCTADKLYKEAIKNSISDKNISLITNGVDYNFFKNDSLPIPNDLKKIKKEYKYVIGYYGALASWFDYELIEKLSKNKNYAIVLIGADYDFTLEKSNVLKNKNVFYLGRKKYEELPAYGKNFDVCTIPFVINDITLSTSPVKVFEYMALEKPIVTTDLPECRKYESVIIAKNHEEFIDKIEFACNKLLLNEEYKEVLRKEAKENDWSIKGKELVNLLDINKDYNKKNKLLIISDNFTIGGVETQILGQIRTFKNRNIDNEVFLLCKNFNENMRHYFKEVFIFKENIFDDTVLETNKVIDEIIKICELNNIGIIHVHPFFSLLPAIISANILKTPIIFTIHGVASITFLNDYYNGYNIYKQMINYGLDKIVCVSESCVDYITPMCKNIIPDLIQNTVDEKVFVEEKFKNSKKWAIITRLDKTKTIPIYNFLSIIKKTKIKHIDIYGEGDEFENLKEFIKNSYLEDYVTLKGYKNKINEIFMEGYDGVIAMGRSLLESLTANLPSVLLSYNGIIDVVTKKNYRRLLYNNFNGRGEKVLTEKEVIELFDKIYLNPKEFFLREYVVLKNNFNDVSEKYCDLLENVNYKEKNNIKLFRNYINSLDSNDSIFNSRQLAFNMKELENYDN